MLTLKELWSVAARFLRLRRERRTHRKLRQALKALGHPWEEHDSGIISVFAGEIHGYGIRVDGFVRDGEVLCLTRVRVGYHHPWLPRVLAITMLEENSRYRVGSNQLMELADGLSIVQRHVCDARRLRTREISDLCETLILQTRQLLVRLYAEDALLPAEELPLRS